MNYIAKGIFQLPGIHPSWLVSQLIYILHSYHHELICDFSFYKEVMRRKEYCFALLSDERGKR